MNQEMYDYLHKKDLDELDKIDDNIKLEIAELKSLSLN